MTFDDGILKIYRETNTAEAGRKPVIELFLISRYYYHIETIGVTRYYQALQANAQVDGLVSVQGWDRDITINDICILDDADGGEQFKVRFIQNAYDDRNLKIRRLTLERIGENYVISN